MTRTRLSLSVAIAAACCGIATTALAKSQEWKKPDGSTFRADASDVIGPWALFDDGTLLPLTALSDSDCVRFYEALKDKPARAADWKDAKSAVSAEIFGRLMRYSGSSLVMDNESGRIEPEFYMVFFATGDRNQSWNMLSGSTPGLYADLMKAHPGLVQGFVFGVQEEQQDYFDTATNTKGDWMWAQFDVEVLMRKLQKMIPSNLYGILVVTRDGVPLFGPEANNDEQIKAIFGRFNGMLNHMRANDTIVWRARAHYLRAVQPVEYANGKCDPLLMGNPLDESKVRQLKIYKIDATFQIAADGTITSVDVKPDGMAPDMVKMFSSGFKRGCIFVPAVDHGRFVDGTYNYHMEISP